MGTAQTGGVWSRLQRGIVGWISDLIPHFGYGVVTALVLHYFYPLRRPSSEAQHSDAAEAT